MFWRSCIVDSMFDFKSIVPVYRQSNMSISVGLRRVVEVFLDLLQGHEHDAVPAREAEEHRVESFKEGLGPLIL